MTGKKPPPETVEQMREQMHRQILSTVSHDLKTPLATIIGSLEIYQRMFEKLTPEKRAVLVQSALTEAYRLDQFITNILDMAKLEAGAVKPRGDQIDLKPMLQDCVTRLGPRAQQHYITIAVSPSQQAPTTDGALLGRAVSLLLDNATKHAGKEARIDIECSSDGRAITIHVRDNGPGIPSGKEEEIFSKYSRLARNDQQNAGTGLGLAICRKIMNLLGGDVHLTPSPTQGAWFTLE